MKKKISNPPATTPAIPQSTSSIADVVLGANPALVHAALTEAYNAYRANFGNDDLDMKLSRFLSKTMYASGAPGDGDAPISKMAAQLVEQLKTQEKVEFGDCSDASGWIAGFLGLAFMAGTRYSQMVDAAIATKGEQLLETD